MTVIGIRLFDATRAGGGWGVGSVGVNSKKGRFGNDRRWCTLTIGRLAAVNSSRPLAAASGGRSAIICLSTGGVDRFDRAVVDTFDGGAAS